MDLKNFISDTLTQISEGIIDAQRKMSGGARVNPYLPDFGDGRAIKEFMKTSDGLHADFVDFDIAVTVGTIEGKKEGVGVVVVSVIGLGKKTESKEENSSISRIKFRIPICWPHQNPYKEEKTEVF